MDIQCDRCSHPDATPPSKLDYKKWYLECNFWIFMFWKHTGIIIGDEKNASNVIVYSKNHRFVTFAMIFSSGLGKSENLL